MSNALKTIVAMPFVLDGAQGVIEVDAAGTRHRIEFTVDPIRQEPIIKHDMGPADRKDGTYICMNGPIQHAQFWPMPRTVFYKLPTTTPGSTRI